MNAIELLNIAHQNKASDIHITVNSPVMFRINGNLKPANQEDITPHRSLEIARELMTQEQYEIFLERGDLDFSYGIEGVSRFRVNVFKQKGNVSLTIRLIPTKIPEMEDARASSNRIRIC